MSGERSQRVPVLARRDPSTPPIRLAPAAALPVRWSSDITDVDAAAVRYGSARALAHGEELCPMTVDIHASVRLSPTGQRGPEMSVHGVPSQRARQILDQVLDLLSISPRDRHIRTKRLIVEILRGGDGSFRCHHALALAVALSSALVGQGVGEEMIYVGDIDLRGRITESGGAVDHLDVLLRNGLLPLPLTVVTSEAAAAWVEGLRRVTVVPVNTLFEALTVTWPRVGLNADSLVNIEKGVEL